MPNQCWTPVTKERLQQLLDKGLTYGACAEILTKEFSGLFTKNACIGMGRRMQVPLRQPRRKGRTCQRRKDSNLSRVLEIENQQRKKIKRAGSLPRHQQRSQLHQQQSQQQSKRRHRPRQLLTLLQLLTHSCRWPHGESPDILFCGDDRAEGSSYCLKHTLIASPGYGRVR